MTFKAFGDDFSVTGWWRVPRSWSSWRMEWTWWTCWPSCPTTWSFSCPSRQYNKTVGNTLQQAILLQTILHIKRTILHKQQAILYNNRQYSTYSRQYFTYSRQYSTYSGQYTTYNRQYTTYSGSALHTADKTYSNQYSVYNRQYSIPTGNTSCAQGNKPDTTGITLQHRSDYENTTGNTCVRSSGPGSQCHPN